MLSGRPWVKSVITKYIPHKKIFIHKRDLEVEGKVIGMWERWERPMQKVIRINHIKMSLNLVNNPVHKYNIRS